jgi:hypothetical protein
MSLEQLERDVAELKKQVAGLVAKAHSEGKDNWLSAVLGRFKDDPEFDNIVRAGQAIRNEVDGSNQQPEPTP